MDDIGPIPGKFPPNADFTSFKYLTPKFQEYLNSNSLISNVPTVSNEYCILPACQIFLIKGVAFIQKINVMYPIRNERDKDFLEERPDFYLGRLFSMFADIVFENFFDLNKKQNFSSKEDALINTMVQEYFWGLKKGIKEAVLSKSISCSYIASKLYPKYYDTFMDLTKYSQFGFEALSAEENK